MIKDLNFKKCIVSWKSSQENVEVLKITSPVPVAMIGYVQKIQSTRCRNVDSFPTDVKEHFNLYNKENFKNAGLAVSISFSDTEKNQFGDFYHLYCRICESEKLPTIWKKYADKLPTEIDIKNLMLNWEKLGVS